LASRKQWAECFWKLETFNDDAVVEKTRQLAKENPYAFWNKITPVMQKMLLILYIQPFPSQSDLIKKVPVVYSHGINVIHFFFKAGLVESGKKTGRKKSVAISSFGRSVIDRALFTSSERGVL